MSIDRLAILSVLILVFAGGCTFLERGRLIAAEGAGRLTVAECGLSQDQRRQNLAAVNGWLIAEGHPHRALALDCDGDGVPDFS